MKGNFMKKYTLAILCSLLMATVLQAQDEEEKEKGFKKENIFTGGGISVGFSNNSFLLGASPVLGYSITNWLDAGIVVNYNYTSYRDYPLYNDKLRESVYGGGVFARLYPIRFLFAQVQFEHNFIRQRYLPAAGGSYTTKNDANSFLIGAGLASGRWGSRQPFFYFALMVDVSGNVYSPYTDNTGDAVPILRAGIQVPLFQKGHAINRDSQ
jgi:hypothetical protein